MPRIAHAQVVASWDLLELPVVDSDQWEANRATAREADAAFDAELLRRAQKWQEEAESGDYSISAADADEESRSGAAPPPPRAYEHEHSQDIFNGAEVAAAGPDGTQHLEAGVTAGSGGSKQQGEGATEANGFAAANTGLVGIMFDAMV